MPRGIYPTNLRQRNVKVVEDFFDKIDSPAKAYAIGFILADGHINVNGRMWNATNTDRRVIDYIHSLVGGSILMPKKQKPHHKQSYQLYVCRKNQVDRLEALGLHHDKSYTATWPKVRRDLEVDLLRGYLDGDGYLSKGRQEVTAVSASKNLMQGYAKSVGKIIGKTPGISSVKTVTGGSGVNFVVGIRSDNDVKTFLKKVYGFGWGMKTKDAIRMISRPKWDHKKSGLKAYKTRCSNFSSESDHRIRSESVKRGWITRRRLSLKS